MSHAKGVIKSRDRIEKKRILTIVEGFVNDDGTPSPIEFTIEGRMGEATALKYVRKNYDDTFMLTGIREESEVYFMTLKEFYASAHKIEKEN